MADNKLVGWASTAKGKPLVQMEFKLRDWDEDCVDLDITHCGICGSDIHFIDEDWGPVDRPCVVGHEIVGTVTRIGKNVKHIKVGDRGGVGPECYNCGKCAACLEGHDNVCESGYVGTYGGKWPNGEQTYGGYADKWRGVHHWVFKVPDSLSSKDAACFFCAGITTYAPLKKFKVDEKSTVGVMGIGGLGHFGILFAKAMGATVVGMSHNDNKKDVAKQLGCDDYMNTSSESDRAKYKKKLTHILCTGTGRDFQWATYFALLHVDGYFMNVSAPDWEFPPLNPFLLLSNQVTICGTAAGSSHDTKEMIELVAEKGIKPWITTYKMSDVNKAHEDFRAGKPRFRYVLEN